MLKEETGLSFGKNGGAVQMRRRESGIVLTSNVLGGTNPPIPLVREFPETPKSERMSDL